MRNIFNFLLKYHFVVLFILLETISIILISQHNFHQRSVLVNSTSSFFGNINSNLNSINEYFNLKKVNQQLARENAMLKSMHYSSFIYEDKNYFFREDTLFQRKFTYMPAKVINNSVNKQNNYLTLNIGRKNGVEPGMGVISPLGVAGIVNEVSENFASVLSILHTETRISGKIGEQNVVGTVVWSGNNYRLAELQDIARYHEIAIGDTVFTSGFSNIFPAKIPIGFVEEFSPKQASDFLFVKIKLATDYSNLSQVYVVKNQRNIEQSNLEEKSQK